MAINQQLQEMHEYRIQSLEQERHTRGDVIDNTNQTRRVIDEGNRDRSIEPRNADGSMVVRPHDVAGSLENNDRRRPPRFGSISQDLDRIPVRDVR